MAEEVKHAGMPTTFRTFRLNGEWQARVLSVVDSRGKVAIVGYGFGLTEDAACRGCLNYWAHRQRNPEVPSAGSLEELRLKMSIGGHT